MKHSYLIFLFCGLLSLQHSFATNDKAGFYGFWEGPHPSEVNKKFYIRIVELQDSVKAYGFWTKNKFYDSQFAIDRLFLNSDSIRFYIPGWNCYYSGWLADTIIYGGFSCPDEPYDAVNLVKNNEAANYLTDAKPDCSNIDYRYQYKQPELFDENIPTARFQTKHDSLFIHSLIPEIISNQYGRINSFLLMKNGSLICEEYFYGYTREDLHQIESTTKSIASLLTGIAKDKGMISDLNEPLYEIFPEYDHLRKGAYRHIKLSHLLSMTSGFSGEYEPYKDYDRIDYALKRKLIAAAGSKFIYDGGNTEILGAVLKRKTGIYSDAFAGKFLFDPLGIIKYDWSVFKQDSFPCMGGYLQMLPTDMLKIGLLVLNNGVYNDKQIISGDWMATSTSPKTKTHIKGDDYGYLWWEISVESGNRTYSAVWANGLGSQFIYIFPELNTIIVTTGSNYEYDSWAITNGIGKYLYLLENQITSGGK